MQIDLKREYENKYVEIREASKRLQEQSEHQITMEKSKKNLQKQNVFSIDSNFLEVKISR